jgi:hypothetical protein
MTEIPHIPHQLWSPNWTGAAPSWHEELLSRLNPNLPAPFLESCQQAIANIWQLDRDPGNAVSEQYGLRTFVRQLRSTGFVNGVYARHAAGGPDPRQALPDWLQTDFLDHYHLSPSSPLTTAERQEISQHFETSSTDWSYIDSLQGRYYTFDPVPTAVNEARHFMYYIENRTLLLALSANQIGYVLNDLREQNLSPAFVKLFDNDRLTLYFKRSIEDGDAVKSVLLANNILGRGPAQHVYSIVARGDRIRLGPWSSNDAALGDGDYNPVTYTSSQYKSQDFSEAYLRLCLYAGKNPTEPYKTSFLYFLTPDTTPPDAALLAQATQLATYPVVAAPSRHSVPLLSGPMS